LKFKRRSVLYIVVMGLLAFGLLYLNYQMNPKAQAKLRAAASADSLKATGDSLSGDSVR